MTLRHLKIFVAVCETGSVTRAAQTLYIAQPTISHTVSELEKYYKVRLFERINQRLVLTDVGRELLAKAKEILTGFEDFESLASLEGQSTEVRIGASLTLGQTLIPPLVRQLRQSAPHLRPHILIRPSTTIEKELESGNLDFAIIESETLSPYLLSYPLQKDELIMVTTVGFEVPDVLTVEQLSSYPLLLRERGSDSRDSLEKALSAKSLHVRPAIDSANNQTLVAAVFQSMGLAYLPKSFVQGHIQRGNLKQIRIEGLQADQANYLVIHKNKKLNTNQQIAFDALKAMK